MGEIREDILQSTVDSNSKPMKHWQSVVSSNAQRGKGHNKLECNEHCKHTMGNERPGNKSTMNGDRIKYYITDIKLASLFF